MTDALPGGWAWVSVAELASTPQDITDGPFGSNLKTEHYTTAGPRVIRLQNIGDGVFLDEEAHIALRHFERLKKHEAKSGDVIVAMLGAHLPRACIAPHKLGLAIVKADCVRLRPDPTLTNSKFVSAGLNSAAVRQQGDDLVHGVGRPRLGLKWFRTLRFPLAPRAEQERVVDALDSYLTRLDDAVASLERVQRKLKAYRASVLRAAVEGRLVPTEASLCRVEKRDYEPSEVLLARILKERRRRWEETELAEFTARGSSPKDNKWKAKYHEPLRPDTSMLPRLPEGWSWVRLGTLMAIRTGFAFKSQHYQSDGDGVALVRQSELRGRKVSLEKVKRLPWRFWTEYGARFGIKKGDIVVGLSGSLSSASVYDENEPALQNQRTGLLILTPQAPPGFLLQTYLSVAEQIEKAGKGVAVQNVAPSDIENFSVALPPFGEQVRISEEVERLLSISEEIATSVCVDLVRCARLRQAILKWAFEGKLVDQDPADEPAEQLLSRIRAERAAITTTKTSRGHTARGAA